MHLPGNYGPPRRGPPGPPLNRGYDHGYDDQFVPRAYEQQRGGPSGPSPPQGYDPEYDGQFASRRYDREPENGPIRGGPNAMGNLLRKFAERTSLQGIPYIYVVRKLYRKILWAVLFIIMTGITIGHLYLILSTFLRFDTTSSISLVRDSHNFPSVTICNINPIEVSRLRGGAAETNGSLYDMWQIYNGLQTNSRRKKRQTQTQTGAVDGGLYGDVTGLNLINDKYLDFSTSNDGLDSEEYGEGGVSPIQLITESFYYFLGQLDKTVREDIGHGNTLILDCQFNGRVCHAENFTRSLSKYYGNCYTFNSADVRAKSYKSLKAGQTLGLQLVLYIQNQEYLTGFTLGKGVRVVTHPFKTMPITESGFSVAPGFETFMGLKMIDITRLNQPYGDCGDKGVFEKRYNYSYTLEACLSTCDHKRIADTCSCYQGESIEYYTDDDLTQYAACDTDEEYACKSGIVDHSQNNPCKCYQGCRETRYEADISMNTWPDVNKWADLEQAICDITGSDSLDCRYMNNVTDADREFELRQNFLKLNVYFEDLTYTKIVEAGSYDLVQFVSDVGGTFGLWIGASILSLCEVMDLLFNCCCLWCRSDTRRRDRRRQPRHMTGFDGERHWGDPRPMFGGKRGPTDPWGAPPPF